jgi:hypothetical protein
MYLSCWELFITVNGGQLEINKVSDWMRRVFGRLCCIYVHTYADNEYYIPNNLHNIPGGRAITAYHWIQRCVYVSYTCGMKDTDSSICNSCMHGCKRAILICTHDKPRRTAIQYIHQLNWHIIMLHLDKNDTKLTWTQKHNNQSIHVTSTDILVVCRRC